MAETRADGWANEVTGLGMAARDKRLSATVARPQRTDPRQLEDLYTADPLARRICELPAREQTRKWLTFTVDGKEDVSKAMGLRMQELRIQDLVTQALIWGRLFGAGLLVVGADDGRDPAEPLNEQGVRRLTWLNVLEQHEVEPGRVYGDPFAPKFGEVETYKLHASSIVDAGGSAFGREIHESRVIRFDGVLTPRYRRLENNNWCDSIFVGLLGALRDFWGGFDGAAHLLTDFGQAVFKIQGLANLVASKPGTVVQRMQIIDLVRSLTRAIVIDKDNEDFERKTTPVTGMPELLDRMEQLVAAVTGIPVTLLMGRSPAGENATGESDIRLWYDNVASEQENNLRPKLERLFKLMLLAKDGPTGGKEPEKWSFAFRPLWQPTAKEQAEIRKINAEADAIDIASQVLHPEEVRQSRYGGGDYSTQTTLDPDLSFEDMVQPAPVVDPNDPEASDPEADDDEPAEEE